MLLITFIRATADMTKVAEGVVTEAVATTMIDRMTMAAVEVEDTAAVTAVADTKNTKNDHGKLLGDFFIKSI